MTSDNRSIGEKLEAIDRHARDEATTPGSKPGNKEPAEGSRETVMGGGISHRPEEERQRHDNLPPRGKARRRSHA